ncbi:MAG: hypothetical protein JXK94_00110 [Deltaproteobacteria bacterium]|nr:hypothetical protein [Deltaproteobacteria bacterium]
MFRVNEVVKKEQTLYRILKLLPEEVVWIPVEDEKAFPSLVLKKELTAAIDDEILTRHKDPYEYLALENPIRGSKNQLQRDKNYALIKPLIDEPLFYDPKIRSSIIQRIIQEQGTTKQTLYRNIKRYWQRGQTPNALIPDYTKCGGKGSKHTAKDKKLGRPRKYTPGVGAFIDDHIEKMFRRIVEKYEVVK